MLDIGLFCPDKDDGAGVALVKASQRLRCAGEALVDEVVILHKAWRDIRTEQQSLQTEISMLQKEVAKRRKAKESDEDLQAKMLPLRTALEDKKPAEKQAQEVRDEALHKIGNLVDSKVPETEDRTECTVGAVGEASGESHIDLMAKLDFTDMEKGTAVAGARGYFLKGDGVLLANALIRFGLDFAVERGFVPMQVPFFMTQPVSAL